MFPHTKPPAGTQINPLNPLSNGLVGCWLFNEGDGSLANDVSGNNNHGRLTNMAPNVQGSGWSGSKFGGGLDFDGDNDVVSFSNVVVTNKITVCAWAKTDLTELDYRHIVGEHPGYYLSADTNIDYMRFVIETQNPAVSVNFDTFSNIGTDWHYYCGVYDGTNIHTYFDGVFKNTAAQSGNIDLTGSSCIGGYWDGGFNWGGSIDSVSIYNRALSAEEIAWLYREPYAMFEPAFNPALLYSAPPVGAIMNQFQKANIGADLYNGVFA